ncbi:MAG: NAD(P)-dependent oxidoreductase [Candidatus Thalassarchaeaceae archaeon]|nr:NAD(P)-dependent oxidoreductase [Candidatus Thalassarchaeaceae archaeon]
MGEKELMGEHVKVAISGQDDFVQPYLEAALGDNLVQILPEMLNEKMQLDVLLTSCDAIVLMNAHPPITGTGRDDRTALLAMRDAARPILEAVERHGSLHLLLIGTLRVHPQPTPEDPFYSSQVSLVPRDIAAEGQLWVEERAIEHATENSPVSVLRCSNVQGVRLDSNEGNGILHQFAQDSIFGWLSVPGDGTQAKDFVHISDVIEVVMHILENRPPTRETLCIGTGEGSVMSDVAAIYQERTGCDPQYGNDDSHEVWGVVDAWEIEQRCGFRPSVTPAEMIEEAFENAGA